jgi:hypothetical protein
MTSPGVLDTTLSNKVCRWLATDRWFHPPINLAATSWNIVDSGIERGSNLQLWVVIGTDFIGSRKFYYHTITTTRTPVIFRKLNTHTKKHVLCNFWKRRIVLRLGMSNATLTIFQLYHTCTCTCLFYLVIWWNEESRDAKLIKKNQYFVL